MLKQAFGRLARPIARAYRSFSSGSATRQFVRNNKTKIIAYTTVGAVFGVGMRLATCEWRPAVVAYCWEKSKHTLPLETAIEQYDDYSFERIVKNLQICQRDFYKLPKFLLNRVVLPDVDMEKIFGKVVFSGFNQGMVKTLADYCETDLIKYVEKNIDQYMYQNSHPLAPYMVKWSKEGKITPDMKLNQIAHINKCNSWNVVRLPFAKDLLNDPNFNWKYLDAFMSNPETIKILEEKKMFDLIDPLCAINTLRWAYRLKKSDRVKYIDMVLKDCKITPANIDQVALALLKTDNYKHHLATLRYSFKGKPVMDIETYLTVDRIKYLIADGADFNYVNFQGQNMLFQLQIRKHKYYYSMKYDNTFEKVGDWLYETINRKDKIMQLVEEQTATVITHDACGNSPYSIALKEEEAWRKRYAEQPPRDKQDFCLFLQ
ncbi:MAG: hypothetical protein Edafosvirus11_34 [Edafosvirus sp.]|uniref:Uncharacterized protein n=1 Tax=Edafosvirus sp. TaxID=2487765 RepID=A0A3G4ZYC3_9VIRU|nr:MAG: hypothetical protein Edafosvirus11_34 [Edafosvirus sp.]